MVAMTIRNKIGFVREKNLLLRKSTQFKAVKVTLIKFHLLNFKNLVIFIVLSRLKFHFMHKLTLRAQKT